MISAINKHLNQTQLEILCLSVFLISTFFLKLLFILMFPITFFSDDAIYASIARNFTFHPTWPPLFPFVSFITYLFLQSWESSLRLVSAISSTLLLIPLYLLTKSVFTLPKRMIYLCIITFSYPFFLASVVGLSDSLAVSLTLSGLVSIFFGLFRKENKFYLLGGIFLGLSYLTRSEGSLFFDLTIAFYFLLLLFQFIFKKKWLTFKNIALFIFSFFIISSPYIIATKNQLGSWSMSAKFSAQIQQEQIFAIRKNGTTWAQEVASIKSPNYHSEYYQGGLSYILEYSDYILFQYGNKLRDWYFFFISYFPIWTLPFIIIGVYSLLLKSFIPHLYLLFMTIPAILIAVFATNYPEDRYFLWIFPIVLYFLLSGFSFIEEKLKLKTSGNILFIVSIALFLLTSTFNSKLIKNPTNFGKNFSKANYLPQIRQTGQWIKQNSVVAHPKIMARHEAFEFYSDGETIYLPQINYDDLIKYARRYHVDYLIAWEAEIASDKNLKTLLEPDSFHPDLNRVYTTKTTLGALIVYELNP